MGGKDKDGNVKDLFFNTNAITEDTEFEVRITRPNDTDIPVERVVKLWVTVRP